MFCQQTDKAAAASRSVIHHQRRIGGPGPREDAPLSDAGSFIAGAESAVSTAADCPEPGNGKGPSRPEEKDGGGKRSVTPRWCDRAAARSVACLPGLERAGWLATRRTQGTPALREHPSRLAPGLRETATQIERLGR
ncbi:hypothetical protein AAFF_G00059020 [Aldrovandia affinis]|uniref:Uncharacterized protein n=1 Tax=Aldrovandia affinis TaxID=143900 RepID=A0AAD7S0F9_9TELE|nr:hypothetical protein AAFF_G00059020 [Aldrovandia affinis]